MFFLQILLVALQFYSFVLLARVVIDLVMIFSRDWQPRGFMLIVANWVYKLTDPPLRFLHRKIPMLQLGNIALDMGFLVLFFGVSIAKTIVVQIMSTIS